MPKPKTPKSLTIELPKDLDRLSRRKRIPRIVVDISEDGASLVRCPDQDIDIEIHDYDVPEDWDGPEKHVDPVTGIETGIKKDVFGRRYEYIKFRRRAKKSNVTNNRNKS